MSDIYNVLLERIREYNQKWEYKENKDMASCIVKVLGEQFLLQQEKIAQIPMQKQNILYNQLPFSDALAQRQYIRVFFTSKDPIQIPLSTPMYAQDEEGNVAPYELTRALYVQNCHISSVLSVDGTTQTICRMSDGSKKNMYLRAHEAGDQVHALYFHIPNMFDHNENLVFDVCLSCAEMLWTYLLDPRYVKVCLQLEHERIELRQLSRNDNALHIKADISQEQRMQIRGLWIQGIDISTLPPQYIKDASFVWQGSNLRCDHIFGEEQAYEREEVPLFGAPMHLYNSCYICENETLSNPEAVVTLHFNISTKCMDQGMEFIKPQEFRAIMKTLPVDIPIYDAYADVVVLEYFNGQAWCTLPNTQGIQSIFKQVEERSFQIRFLRPSDLKPCRIMGKFAYYLRFRLVKSDHLYQQPCHIHVPYISHVRFHYTMRKSIKAERTYLYENLHKHDITKQLGREGCTLFARLHVEGKAIFLGLQHVDNRYPCTFYVDIKHSQASGSPLCIAYATKHTFESLNIEDCSDALMHSGEITIMFPKTIEKTYMFEEEAYWLRLTFLDQEIHDIEINEIIWNSVIVASQKHALTTISKVHVEQMKDVKVHFLKGPYGNIKARTQVQERKRVAHQLMNFQHPLSLKDMKEDILHEFMDIADIVLLDKQNAYREQSEDCHVLVFVKDMEHHTSLFHIRKKDILTYLMQYEACIAGKFIIEEPVFVRVSIHVRCRAPQKEEWVKQQAIRSFIEIFLNPITGGRFHEGIKIKERFDMNFLKAQCEKEIVDIQIQSWQATISFQKHGKHFFYAYEDMPDMLGFLLMNGEHTIEMEGF